MQTKRTKRLAVAVITFAVCGASCGGSQSPTAPTLPVVSTPAPSPTPPAAARANLVVVDAIEFDSCLNGLCSFRGLIRNDGNACAANISGESWIVSAQGQEVARARWAMLPGTTLRPADSVYYVGDGMPQVALNHLDGRYFANFIFDSRTC